MLAYLVIREGPKWSDVFRLVPGETVTIGRAPTCQVVVKDERCSRAHAEVFFSEGKWTVRDLQSRNGTAVTGKLIEKDFKLTPGDMIQVGRSQMVFVDDLTRAFPDSSGVTKVGLGADGDRPTSHETSEDLPQPIEPTPTAIIHRQRHTRLLEPHKDATVRIGPPAKEVFRESPSAAVGPAAGRLCRVAFELAQCQDKESLANKALAGVFEGTKVDAGAIYLLPPNHPSSPTANNLELIASRSDTPHRYHKISPFLADTVLTEGEAVLARNILGDETLGSQNTQGQFHSTCVLCAPIRRDGKIRGLIHLYSTSQDRMPDPEDLEYTLAVADTVAVAIDNLTKQQTLEENLDQVLAETEQLRERLAVQSEIVGNSRVVHKITEQIGRAAPSKATVLIRGESGVGKELVARAIHFSSQRKKEPFVCLNCAALTESLLESELFGHEKGAFTGATERKMGKFEAADGGTLMLDEIGEMSPHLQAKFLRVLEGHPFERVGGSKPIKVDVRVIAATNRDLEKEVEKNTFRRDLYFRLRVVEIFVPGLRKRPDDIPVLATYFLKKFAAEAGRKIRGFTRPALDQMMRYRWPGNVRELKNVIERAIVLCERDEIDAGDLMLSRLATSGDTTESPAAPAEFTPMTLADVEKRHIEQTLNATGWNKSQTANILGIERSTLDRKIQRYDIVREMPVVS